MAKRRIFILINLLLIASLAACTTGRALPISQPALPTPPPTLVPSRLPSFTPFPTLTATFLPSSTPGLTATPAPKLPCGGVMPEKVYLYLDCADIRRIREQIRNGIPEVRQGWFALVRMINEYRRFFPDDFNPNMSAPVLWSGPSGQPARVLGLDYLVTGDPAVANDIVRLLNLVVAKTPKVTTLQNPREKDANGNWNAAGLMSGPSYSGVVYQSTLFAYLVVRETGWLTEKQTQDFNAFFKNQARLLEQASQVYGNQIPLDSDINRNVPFGVNVAAATIAAAFRDDEQMLALYQRVRKNLDWQLENWWEKDGGWGENTDSYGFNCLDELLILSESLIHQQMENLYARKFGQNDFHQFCRYYLNEVTPEGVIPGLNDSMPYAVDPGLLELCAYRTSDAQLMYAYQMYVWSAAHAFGRDVSGEWGLSHLVIWAGLWNGAPPQPPSFTSVLLPDTGAAVLRENWNHDSQYLLLQYTASKVHRDYSFGAIYLYDHGPWMVGNGYHLEDYERSIATNQHSTLGMDNLNQTETGGTLLAFADLGNTGIASVSSRSYSNLTHTRSVLWVKSWHQWLVVDDAVLEDQDPHTLQLRFYVRAKYLDHLDNQVWVFGTNLNRPSLEIDLPAESQAKYAQIKREYQVGSITDNATGVSMELAAQGSPVRLITSLAYTSQVQDRPQVTREVSDGGTMIESQMQEDVWTWFLPAVTSNKGELKQTNLLGQAGCLARRAGRLLGYCLLNGRQFNSGGLELVQAQNIIYLEADFSANQVWADSPSGGEISFYWPTEVSKITINQAGVDFTQKNGLITLKLPVGKVIFEIE